MSRANYSNDLDLWDLIRWQGAVASAMRGKRGRTLLADLAAALDAMPEKVLIHGDLVNKAGDCCALGAVAIHRHMPIEGVMAIDPEDSEQVAKAFNVAEALAREVAYQNDEMGRSGETPQQRWERIRLWVAERLERLS